MTGPNLRGPVVLSIAAAVATIALKTAAYAVTGSVGLLSDALESGVNLLAALTAYFSLWYATRPADASHTYGHEKIEFFSAGLEGALVVAAGVGAAVYAVRRLFAPADLTDLGTGAALALAASAINVAVARVLLAAGRKHGSPILEADGHHLMADVVTSLAVVGGLGLVALTGVPWLDAVLALGVGLLITRTGFRLVRQSFDGLMDHALPAADQAALRDAIRSALPTGAAFHLLRTRRAGRRRFADFHLLVAGRCTVRDAHELAHVVEAHLRQAVPDLEVTTHIEPIEDDSSWEAADLARLGEPTGPALTGGTP